MNIRTQLLNSLHQPAVSSESSDKVIPHVPPCLSNIVLPPVTPVSPTLAVSICIPLRTQASFHYLTSNIYFEDRIKDIYMIPIILQSAKDERVS